MTGKVFLDTNIAIYAADHRDKRKQRIARETMWETRNRLAISTQVLQETFLSLVGKVGISRSDAKSYVQELSWREVVTITPNHVEAAMDYCDSFRISFWDALIVAAAESANCEAICTEDLNSGQSIRGLRIWNPFK